MNKYLIIVLITALECNASIKEINIFVPTNDLVPGRNLFDQDLYDSSLDPELCDRQLGLIFANVIYALPFIDAGFRLPRGILDGNMQDLGNYHQCLAISQDIEDTVVEGKYCSISIPLDQELNLPEFPTLSNFSNTPDLLVHKINEYRHIIKEAQLINSNRTTRSGLVGIPLPGISLSVALCIPKTCTTQQYLNTIVNNLEFNENFCRLPNDKPTVPADYVTIAIFSVIGLLVVISTTYDLVHMFLLKKELKEKSALYSSFSVYTNTQRLLTFKPGADSLDCLDGIRTISIMWIVVGHTYATFVPVPVLNLIELFQWSQSMSAVWVRTAYMAVDTFFIMSGLLCAYTVAKKTSRMSFLKNIPLFYLHRYLRLFPLLAATILLHVSLAHHIADGPLWNNVVREVRICREYWWSTLLYVQNYVNYNEICINQSWYLSVDMQLYWISPLVLVWLCAPRHGDGRRTGWSAVTLALFISLTASTIFCFIVLTEGVDYNRNYYINTLTRAPPFFVGLMFGYLLHVWRGRKIEIHRALVAVLWLATIGVLLFSIFIQYTIEQPDFDNENFENFLNSFMRSFWAAGIGWIILACKHNYGGPVNWFLSLQLWKVPARLSYAMYLLHLMPMNIAVSIQLFPLYFTQWNAIFRFFADMVVTVILSFVLTLAVDSPFSTLQKIVFEGGSKKRSDKNITQNTTNMTSNMDISKQEANTQILG